MGKPSPIVIIRNVVQNLDASKEYFEKRLLTHFWQMFPFYTP